MLAKDHVNQSFCEHHAFSLLKLALSKRPKIIHTHGYKAGIIGRIIAKLLYIKCLSTFHAGEELSGKIAVFDWLDRASAFLCDRVLTVSPQISKNIYSSNNVVNNFIDVNNIRFSEGKKIAFVGRLNHEKGPDIFSRIAEFMPHENFHFYGDGPLRQKLEKTRSCNLHFHGHQQDMECVWGDIGLLVLTSRFEGMPMAVLEAMAHGVPVVASNVGTVSKIIDHNVNGWLVQSAQAEEHAQYIYAWSKMDKKKKESMAIAAREKIERFYSNERMIPQYIKIYNKVLCNKPKLRLTSY